MTAQPRCHWSARSVPVGCSLQRQRCFDSSLERVTTKIGLTLLTCFFFFFFFSYTLKSSCVYQLACFILLGCYALQAVQMLVLFFSLVVSGLSIILCQRSLPVAKHILCKIKWLFSISRAFHIWVLSTPTHPFIIKWQWA